MIYLSTILLFGLITVKAFRYGVLTLLGSVIVFSIVIAIGIVFNVFYPSYMALKNRSLKLFFQIYWRLIKGTFVAVGNIFYSVALNYDITANVWSEWVEDAVTHEEKTTFGNEDVTISASIGYLEYSKIKMYKTGKFLSKVLNLVFGQTRHAIGSWENYLIVKELENKNLHGNK